MNIALVTNKELHHKYWIYKLYSDHNVKLILHPNKKIGKNIISKIKKKKFGTYGLAWFGLKLVSLIYNRLVKKSMQNSLKINEMKYFKQYENQYNKIPKDIIFDVETVNSPDVIELVKKNNIDVICFLGGDIAKKEFVSSAKRICLNYHSGMSPFYNGNKTIFHAVSDFRPNFAGGTLMKMNVKIDGGDILAHYLCPIDKEDSAADIFMKGIIGSVKLYGKALDELKKRDLSGVIQKRSFKNVRNRDWTLTNDIRLSYFEKSKKMRFYKRSEKIIDYTKLDSGDINELYKISLQNILSK